MADATKRATSRCPICRSPTVADYRPFCSARCRDVDLARWLGGAYTIPGPDLIEDGESPAHATDDDGEHEADDGERH